MVSDVPNLLSREATRTCVVCEDEIPDEHFFDHVDRWQALWKREFGEACPPGL